MEDKIRSELLLLADDNYREFSQSLIPQSKPLIGIRLPVLRRFAKERLYMWKDIVNDKQEDIYFEEVMLRGMMIGYGSSREGDIDAALNMLDEFIPKVDNWSICDSCCVSFSIFRKNRNKVFDHIQRYLYSDKEFEVRVGLIILLDHFLKCNNEGDIIKRKKSVTISDIDKSNIPYENGQYIDIILDIVNRQFTQGYYAMMAAAWLIAESFVVYPAKTYSFLSGTGAYNNRRCIDKITFNKALQKICESRTPDADIKAIIKLLKNG